MPQQLRHFLKTLSNSPEQSAAEIQSSIKKERGKPIATVKLLDIAREVTKSEHAHRNNAINQADLNHLKDLLLQTANYTFFSRTCGMFTESFYT